MLGGLLKVPKLRSLESGNNAINIVANGFALFRDGAELGTIEWSSVSEIIAYKLDLVTTDEVRIRLTLDTHPNVVEVSEEFDGFDAFRDSVEKVFRLPAGWWTLLLQPAFSRNESLLYSRSEI